MPINPNGQAPYAPASTVLEIIRRYRERGLASPFDLNVMAKAGVSDSLAARTLQALRLLDLIDDEGMPSAALVDLGKAPEDEFASRLAELIRVAYADVFAFSDPAIDDVSRIRDAFRQYEPRGQQGRMVTLFLGLCEASAIVSKAPRAKAGRKPSTNGTPARKPRKPAGDQPAKAQRTPAEQEGTIPRLPDSIAGLVKSLPTIGHSWDSARRDAFVAAFTHLLEFEYPAREAGKS